VHIFDGLKRVVLFAVSSEDHDPVDSPAGCEFPAPQLYHVLICHRLDLDLRACQSGYPEQCKGFYTRERGFAGRSLADPQLYILFQS
jgi:hypothetical protein